MTEVPMATLLPSGPTNDTRNDASVALKLEVVVPRSISRVRA